MKHKERESESHLPEPYKSAKAYAERKFHRNSGLFKIWIMDAYRAGYRHAKDND